MPTRTRASLSSLAASLAPALGLLLALTAPVACTHTEAKADPAPSTAAATPPVAPVKTASSEPAPAPKPEPKPEPDEISGCTTVNDCTFTRVAAGACCPLLCTPRVVTKARAAELGKNIAVCNAGRDCPLPPCRAPVADFRIVCEQQKCLMKITPITNVVQ